jgi:O-antigen/teichoic acid export membrane protein
MVGYSAPLIPSGLALPFLYAGDKLLMAQLAPALALGLYDMAAKLAGVLNVILVQGFQTAFNAIGFKEHGATGGAELHRRTFRHYAVFSGGFALGLSLFAGEVLPLVVQSDQLLGAEVYVFPLALGLVAYGLYLIVANVLLVRGLTARVSGIVFGAAALNLALNVLLIPPLEAWGAAIATLVSYGGLAVVAGVMAQRAEGHPFAWRHLVAVLVVVCAIYLPSRLMADWTLWARLGGKAGLMALYPFGVLALGVYRWGEVRRGARGVWAQVQARRR